MRDAPSPSSLLYLICRRKYFFTPSGPSFIHDFGVSILRPVLSVDLSEEIFSLRVLSPKCLSPFPALVSPFRPRLPFGGLDKPRALPLQNLFGRHCRTSSFFFFPPVKKINVSCSGKSLFSPSLRRGFARPRAHEVSPPPYALFFFMNSFSALPRSLPHPSIQYSVARPRR